MQAYTLKACGLASECRQNYKPTLNGVHASCCMILCIVCTHAALVAWPRGCDPTDVNDSQIVVTTVAHHGIKNDLLRSCVLGGIATVAEREDLGACQHVLITISFPRRPIRAHLIDRFRVSQDF